MTRTFRHLSLALLTAGLVGLAAAIGAPADAGDRVSLTTSWICMGLLSAALLIGPLHARRSGRPLFNHLPRRDLAIWGALAGMIHFGLAFRYSMNMEYMARFIDGALQAPSAAVRRELYFWSVIAGLVIAALFLLLLALSSNAALRMVGARWWKRLQRASYAAFALTAAHGVVFQIIESRSTPLVAAFALLTTAVIVGQCAGVVTIRRKTRAPGTTGLVESCAESIRPASATGERHPG
jgi:DMSO/TMAO reductase YedYZ heme-binding membrane subunit